LGKTLTSIIAVGAAIAINVVPGVGTAISTSIIGGLYGAGVAAGTAVTIGYAVTSALTLGVTAYGLQAGANLLGLGPSMPKPDTTVTAIKTSRPPRVSAYGVSRLYGAYSLYETASNGTAVDVLAVHDGEMTALLAHYLGDDPVTLTGNVVNTGADNRYRDGSVSLYTTDGSTPGTPIAAITSLLPGIWTSDHRGDGVVLLAQTAKAVKSKRYLETYPNGVPVPSIVAQWQKCPDPYADDPSDPAGWTWTENPVRHLMHYKLVREKVDYATKIAPTLSYWQAAADICDEAISLKAGGTEARYRSSVAHNHTDQHANVTAALLSTFDGWIAPRADGALVVYAGKYYAPTVSIGPDQIIAYEWNGVGVDDDSAVNEIICSYISADHDYNTVETDAWRDEDDISERGQVLSSSLDPQVPSWGQVRRLAKRKMARTNALYRGSVTTNAAGRITRGQRFINLRIEEAGTVFFDGPAEITAVTRNLMTGGVTFSWVAADPNIDAWNPATEEGNPAAKGDRVAQQPVETPEITMATAVLASDGTSAQVLVDVDAPDRDDLTWFGRWKVSTDTVWNEQEYSDIAAGSSIELLIGLVPVDSSIDVAVAYRLGDGRVSDWSATDTVSTSTAMLAPAAPTEVTADGGAGEADVTWRNPSSANLSYVKVFRNTVDDFGTASAISGEIVGGLGQVMSITDTSLTAGNYWWWVVAYNATDTASAPGGPATATVT